MSGIPNQIKHIDAIRIECGRKSCVNAKLRIMRLMSQITSYCAWIAAL